MHNPQVQNLRVYPTGVHRPILLLGFSSNRKYVREYIKRVNIECKISSFAETIDVHSVHFSPHDHIENIRGVASEVYKWALKYDPLFVAGWVEGTDFNSSGAQAMLGAYAQLLQRFGDPEFCYAHDTTLEFAELKAMKISSPDFERVRELQARRADGVNHIFYLENPAHGCSFGASLPVMIYSHNYKSPLKQAA